MADFQNAGYRLLSFKYTPPPAEKRQAADDDKAGHGSTSQPEGEELPSLSSLLTSLQELEGLDDDGIKETDSIVELREKDKQSPPKTTPLNKFHLFNDLPTEIRLKIWALTFLPRVVEVRPPRPPRPEHSQGQWQSGCSNPAALAVSIEAREAALEHFRIPFPLAAIAVTPNTGRAQQHTIDPIPFHPLSTTYRGLPLISYPPSAENSYIACRTLYISPEHDTVCLLGQDWDSKGISHVMQTFREADPIGSGIQRLGLAMGAWGFGGSAVMLKGLGTTLLRELDQLVLFMFGGQHPPPVWRAKGSALVEGEERELYRQEGNRCELVLCENGSARHAYRVWSGVQGRQFWDEDGNVLRIGRKSSKIWFMNLEFKDGW